MSEEVMEAACQYIFQSGTAAGICFFGGEPLLQKDLIYKAVARCQTLSKETGMPFSCKMTTNGTLLDETFIAYAKRIGLFIGLSFDGCGQDRCRRYRDGSGTFSDLERNAKLLLSAMPESYAMMTIAPQTVDTYADSVRYLHRLGFHNITATLAYGKRVHWTDAHLEQLQTELNRTADFYAKEFEREPRFISVHLTVKFRTAFGADAPANTVIWGCDKCLLRRMVRCTPVRSSLAIPLIDWEMYSMDWIRRRFGN